MTAAVCAKAAPCVHYHLQTDGSLQIHSGTHSFLSKVEKDCFLSTEQVLPSKKGHTAAAFQNAEHFPCCPQHPQAGSGTLQPRVQAPASSSDAQARGHQLNRDPALQGGRKFRRHFLPLQWLLAGQAHVFQKEQRSPVPERGCSARLPEKNKSFGYGSDSAGSGLWKDFEWN